jgi:hypothetical protein
MIRKQQQESMIEYLVGKISDEIGSVKPMHKEIVSGIESNYILLGKDGIVLMVDQKYPDGSFDKVYTDASKIYNNVGVVFYKGENTFFRPAAPIHHYKKTGRSMKNYTEEEMHRMIMFRPEEIFMYHKDGQKLQYYQPESARLEEGIMTYVFGPVNADYSHISSKRFKPQDRTFIRDHIIKDEKFYDGKLKLVNGILVPL